ncbi:PilZ domain-containing protein [Kaarinaea lacus]
MDMTGLYERSLDRHTLSLHMEVFQSARAKEPLFKCRTRNIGLGGVMIRNRGLRVRKGSSLTLLLKATCRSGKKQILVNAKVVWKTPTAIGLQFSPVNESDQKNFKRFLFEAKVATHSRARKRWQGSQDLRATVVHTSGVNERAKNY